MIALCFASSGERQVIRLGDQMNRGTSLSPAEAWVEPLDIDVDSLDHALMELLTSDWQTLDDNEPLPKAEAAPRLSPLA